MQRGGEHPSLTAALRALRLRPGPPTEADVPKPVPLPGRKPKLIVGQLDFDGNEYGSKEPAENADGDGEP
jgi:hypothetical protein